MRKLLSNDNDNLKLKGLVGIDESYIGGKEANKHENKKIVGNKGRRAKTKSLVIGAIEKSGKAITKVIKNVKKDTIKFFVEDNIENGSGVKTDKLNGAYTIETLNSYFV